MTTTPPPMPKPSTYLYVQGQRDIENLIKARDAQWQERITKLERDLQFVERWANHHGAKPHTTAESALSVIQHYPPIKAITESYADGKVPDTFDPYERITALEADAERLDWIAMYGTFGVDSATGLAGGNGQKRVAATRSAIDAARAALENTK